MRPRSNSAVSTYITPSTMAQARLQPKMPMKSARLSASSCPSRTAPVKPSAMMRPKRTSPSRSAGSRYRWMKARMRLSRHKSTCVRTPSTHGGVGAGQGGIDHLRVEGDVEPRRHGDVVEELAADLVADAETLQQVFVAHAEVERAEAPAIVRSSGEQSDAADPAGRVPPHEVGVAVRQSGPHEDAEAAVAVAVEELVRVVIERPGVRARWSGRAGRGGRRRGRCAGRRRCPCAARRCRRARRRSARPRGPRDV